MSEALLQAIQSSNISEVRRLLSTQDIDINETINNGKVKKTALYIAVEIGNIEIIQCLLSNSSIDVNKKSILVLPNEEENNYYYGDNANEYNTYSDRGYYATMSDDEQRDFCNSHDNTMETTALYLAVSIENQEVVQMLLNHSNIDVNCISVRKYCAMRSPYETQRLDNTYWNTQKKTPLHLAIEKKNKNIVQLLLNHNQIKLDIPFIYESGYNFLEKYSISKSPLCVAIDADCFEVFQLIIDHNDVDASFLIEEREKNEARRDYTASFRPIHLAAKKGNAQIMSLLLTKHEVDVNSLYESDKTVSIKTTALNIAIENNHTDVVRVLLLHPHINVTIDHIYIDIIRYQKDEKKEMTPLYLAVEKRNKEMVRLLLTKPEIDVNKLINHSKTIGYSAYRGIKTTQIKMTPLNLAIENEDAEIVELLLIRANTDVNACYLYDYDYTKKEDKTQIKEVTKKKLSPLFVAVQKNNERIVGNLLLNSQIDLNFQSIIEEKNVTTEKTAIELANENGNEIIINLLNRYS